MNFKRLRIVAVSLCFLCTVGANAYAQYVDHAGGNSYEDRTVPSGKIKGTIKAIKEYKNGLGLTLEEEGKKPKTVEFNVFYDKKVDLSAAKDADGELKSIKDLKIGDKVELKYEVPTVKGIRLLKREPSAS
jgi:hypothetical protein